MLGSLVAQTPDSRRAELDVLRPVTLAANGPANALGLLMSADTRRDEPAAVADLAGRGSDGGCFPGQGAQLRVQVRLVAEHRPQVARVLRLAQEQGVVPAGLHRVAGHDDPGQRQRGEQRPEVADLVRLPAPPGTSPRRSASAFSAFPSAPAAVPPGTRRTRPGSRDPVRRRPGPRKAQPPARPRPAACPACPASTRTAPSAARSAGRSSSITSRTGTRSGPPRQAGGGGRSR